jgi:hypothetical protein
VLLHVLLLPLLVQQHSNTPSSAVASVLVCDMHPLRQWRFAAHSPQWLHLLWFC